VIFAPGENYAEIVDGEFFTPRSEATIAYLRRRLGSVIVNRQTTRPSLRQILAAQCEKIAGGKCAMRESERFHNVHRVRDRTPPK